MFVKSVQVLIGLILILAAIITTKKVLAAPSHMEYTKIGSILNTTSDMKFNLKWTTRTEWQAAAPIHPLTAINAASGVVSHVIIHHTATSPDACRKSANACATTVRAMQRSHQQDRGWDDIGYNFLIGGSDERAEIYEGRGFNVIGAHAVGYNARSVGIALIGDWTAALPPRPVLEQLKQLINYGIQMGYIQSDYKLLGHRQVKPTACPGARLYQQLTEWPHYATATS